MPLFLLSTFGDLLNKEFIGNSDHEALEYIKTHRTVFDRKMHFANVFELFCISYSPQAWTLLSTCQRPRLGGIPKPTAPPGVAAPFKRFHYWSAPGGLSFVRHAINWAFSMKFFSFNVKNQIFHQIS